MMTRAFSSIILASAVLAGAAAANDFEHLRAHWNFDEGRDWHNMPFPYNTPVNRTRDLVDGNDITLKGTGAKWVAGRQYSGISGSDKIRTKKPIKELQGTCSLSYWILCGEDTPAMPGGIIGSDDGMAWGCINKGGKLGISSAGRSLATTKDALNDGIWHHVVITRNADTGDVQIYLDGKLAAKGKGAKADEASYTTFNADKISLDQVHVFDTVVSPETVRILFENHAPKAYPQIFLVDRKKPTVTGSVLHGFTYDPELDKLSVHAADDDKFWESNGDGTFTFTPPKNFKGEAKKYATVTDGRGGFCRIPVVLRDSRSIGGQPIKEFTYVAELDAFPDTGEKAGQHRNPIAVDLGGKLPQLIVQANNRLWFCRNQSKRGKISFAAPVEILDKSKQPVKTDGAAVLDGNRLLVRNNDGTMQHATLRGKGTPQLILEGEVKDTDGKPFKCKSRHFIVIDFDNDDIPDIVTGESAGLYYYKGEAAKGSSRKAKKGSNQRISFAAEGKIIHGRQYNIAPAMGDLNGDSRPELVYGINWGTTHAWINDPDKADICKGSAFELKLLDAPKENLVRDYNGAHCTIADFDGDDTPDILFGDNKNGGLISARGVSLDTFANNLKVIEKEFYDGNTTKVGRLLEANDRAGMKRYKELMVNWIRWAISTNTPAKRQKAFDMLVEHSKKYDFLQRTTLKEAWIKKDQKTGETTYGDMHHVPGIFTQNWIVLDQLLPDSEAKLKAVADALGLKGTDREQYLTTGMPLADNNRCSDGQLNAIRDLLSYHPHILFPDDHISIGVMFGDGRDAMSYIFKSNKNTFLDEVGSCIAEMHGDMVQLAEECLGGKNSARGDYFTFVLAHEVCHSLDGYVHSRTNRDLHRRWGDMMVYAATNAGETDHVVAGENGWWNHQLTKERFKERNLWDGDNSTWDASWKQYWEKCAFRNKVFMRGNVDWFLGAMQETLATQANHHWARSEARLIGAILRYLQGYKSNINEVVLYLDILSAGMNKIPMYHPHGLKNPPRVQFDIDYAWLVRNDQGYITDVHIGDRHYSFEVNETGRVVGVKSYPFAEQIQKAAGK